MVVAAPVRAHVGKTKGEQEIRKDVQVCTRPISERRASAIENPEPGSLPWEGVLISCEDRGKRGVYEEEK